MFGCLRMVCGAVFTVFEGIVIYAARCCPTSIMEAICCCAIWHNVAESCLIGAARVRAGGESLIEDIKNCCCPPDQQSIELVGDHHDAV